MKTITIHLDEKDLARFKIMKDATGNTWTQLLFIPLDAWEADL